MRQVGFFWSCRTLGVLFVCAHPITPLEVCLFLLCHKIQVLCHKCSQDFGDIFRFAVIDRPGVVGSFVPHLRERGRDQVQDGNTWKIQKIKIHFFPVMGIIQFTFGIKKGWTNTQTDRQAERSTDLSSRKAGGRLGSLTSSSSCPGRWPWSRL